MFQSKFTVMNMATRPEYIKGSTGSSDTPFESSSNGSLLEIYVSPSLRTFARRLMNSVSASTSSFWSLFQPSTPGTDLGSSQELLAQKPATSTGRRNLAPPKLEFIEFRRDRRPRLPFCEKYDGFYMRKTKTISDSIVRILDSRWKKGEKETLKTYCSKNNAATECMVSAYFDRMKRRDDMLNTKYWGKATKDGEINGSLSFDSASNETEEINQSDAWKMKENEEWVHRSKRSRIAKTYGVIQVPSKKEYSLFDECGIEDATVDLKFKYDINSETLEVTIHRLEDVTDLRNSNKLINSFVQLSMYQRKGGKQKTKTAKHCRDPKFNQTFKIEKVTEKWFHVECLHVELYQKKRFKSVRIGETFVWLDDLDLFSNDNVSITQQLYPCF